MRKTVYVQDDLLARVEEAGHNSANFSELVQKGLESLARMPTEEPSFSKHVDWDTEDRAVLDKILDRVLTQAQEDYRAGRKHGLRIAGRLSARDLERLSNYGFEIRDYAGARFDEMNEDRREGADRLAGSETMTIEDWYGLQNDPEEYARPFLTGRQDVFAALYGWIFGSRAKISAK